MNTTLNIPASGPWLAAVFDMDGTVLDTLEDLRIALNYALMKTGHRHDYTSEEVKFFFGSGIRTALRRAFAVEAGTDISDVLRIREETKADIADVLRIREKAKADISEALRIREDLRTAADAGETEESLKAAAETAETEENLKAAADTAETEDSLKTAADTAETEDSLKTAADTAETEDSLKVAADVAETADDLKAILDVYSPYYKEHCNDHTAPYPGIRHLLQSCREAGIRTAVVSNKPDYAVQILAEEQFPELFDYAIGEREGIPRKPDPEMLREAVRVLEVPRERVLFVGDSEIDLQTARNAGISCAAVSWGFRPRGFLNGLKPEWIFDSCDDLEVFLTGH